MNKTADVIIIGGGIVGCAAAYYLAKSAISDIKCSVKETLSIQELAIYLYNIGDIATNCLPPGLVDII